MRCILPCLLAALIFPAAAHAQTWVGTVTDIRSGAPLGAASVCAGIRGRVDLACAESGSDGSFSVSYPDDFSPGDDGLLYLYVEPPDGTDYYNQVRALQVPPATVNAQLVPTQAYFRGRVVDAATGAPVSGIGVALYRPGSIDESVNSDAEGKFAFGPVVAYENARLQFNTYGVPATDLPPESDGELVTHPYGIRAPYGDGSDLYAEVVPATVADRLEPAVVVTSSSTPDAFTWIEVRLPALGTDVADPGEYYSSQMGEPDSALAGGGVEPGGSGDPGGVTGPGVTGVNDAGLPIAGGGTGIGSPAPTTTTPPTDGEEGSSCSAAPGSQRAPVAMLLLLVLSGWGYRRRLGRQGLGAGLRHADGHAACAAAKPVCPRACGRGEGPCGGRGAPELSRHTSFVSIRTSRCVRVTRQFKTGPFARP